MGSRPSSGDVQLTKFPSILYFLELLFSYAFYINYFLYPAELSDFRPMVNDALCDARAYAGERLQLLCRRRIQIDFL
jgi:hypothetical protein